MSSPLWEGVREGCGTCAFGRTRSWKSMDGVERSAVDCVRYPPAVVPVSRNDGYGNLTWDMEQHHPCMEVSDWCGEYKRNGT